ncbi:hypothetical protein ACWD5Q_28635 [Streptomyces sp. NPDC002513]
MLTDSGLTLAVHEPPRRSGDMFDPSRTWLDQVSLAVADRTALDDRVRRLDDLGVPCSPARNAGYTEFVSVADPDDIARESWAANPGALPGRPGDGSRGPGIPTPFHRTLF